MLTLSPLRKLVEGYLDEMELVYEGGGPYLFRVDSSVVVISLFADGDDTFCRFVAVLLEDLDPTLEFLQRLLQLNTEVLFGSFLLFEEDTLAFSATLLGNHLDLDEFAKTLRYVAHIAQEYGDDLRSLANGTAPLSATSPRQT